jgi:hypothetical protein
LLLLLDAKGLVAPLAELAGVAPPGAAAEPLQAERARDRLSNAPAADPPRNDDISTVPSSSTRSAGTRRHGRSVAGTGLSPGTRVLQLLSTNKAGAAFPRLTGNRQCPRPR